MNQKENSFLTKLSFLKRVIVLFTLILTGHLLNAQIISIDPIFPLQSDSVIIIYDATQGNGALIGQSQIYAHTGVITNLSTSPSDWKYVQGTWGTADNKVKMTALGNNLHKIAFTIDTYYGVPAGQTVLQLAFVFRTEDGSIVGREADGSDIYVTVYNGTFAGAITAPSSVPTIKQMGDNFDIVAHTSDTASLQLYIQGSLVGQASNAKTVSFNVQTSQFGYGKFYASLVATSLNNQVVTDSIYFIVQPSPTVANPPAGVIDGINIINDSTVILQFLAPYKQFAYAIGDFTDWEFDTQYFMKKTTSGDRFWTEITGLDPNKIYGFQYVIDNELMRVPDVYSELYLDPWNDQWISSNAYPNMPQYPTGKTQQVVSTFQIHENEFVWDNFSYTKPSKEKLVIYEMLIRDFTTERTYQSVIDKLDYLDSLNITAIQLMPILEFDGNESWGYNPNFYFAPDKYYGPKNKLKELVQECHRRGIAVILDVALNHSFGLNPQVRMYFDPAAGAHGQPTAQNPWFNQSATHDFNVGYDYNHESQYTREFMNRVIDHWVREYKIDGYRFDLSKGFTQNYTVGNIGAWSAYDQSRINIWKYYRDNLWDDFPGTYMILEHFADNSEETALSNEGFMLWGNLNHNYSENAMGYNADLGWGSYQARGWGAPNLVTYAESHDEERLMYKNLNYGNSISGYNTKTPAIALKRMALAANLLYTIPGPKMLWQFGEIGYDYSINYCPNGTINPDCRTANKPVRWDYYSEPSRRALYNAMADLLYIRKNYPVFHTNNYQIDFGLYTKRVNLYHSSMNAVAMGNFDVVAQNINGNFPTNGWWYEYYSKDSINVTNSQTILNLAAGEYRLYTPIKIARPTGDIVENSIADLSDEHGNRMLLYPNPATAASIVEIGLDVPAIVSIQIFDALGHLVGQNNNTSYSPGSYLIGIGELVPNFDALQPGMYFTKVSIGNTSQTLKMVIE